MKAKNQSYPHGIPKAHKLMASDTLGSGVKEQVSEELLEEQLDLCIHSFL